MTINEFLDFIDYPVHVATCRAALQEYFMEPKEAIKLSRRCMWLAKLRRATNGKYGRQFGIEYPS